MDFKKALSNNPEETEAITSEELSQIVPQPIMPDSLAIAAQQEAIDQPQINPTPVAEPVNLGQIPAPQSEAKKSPESPEERLERLLQDLNSQKKKEREDAESRQFRSNIFKAIAESAGGIVGGAQAMNTGAKVTPAKTTGFDIGDLVGQVDKRFAGDREALMDQYKNLIASRNRAEDVGFKKRELDIKEKAAGKKTEQYKPTEFEKKLDQEGAKTVSDWSTNRPIIQGDIEKLKEVERQLEAAAKSGSKSNLSGSIKGRLPFQDVFNEAGNEVQNTIASVTQKNLREILGGQFAQKEGEDILKRGYDPKVEEGMNLERVRMLRKAMEQSAAEKDRMSQYANQNKSLRGYEAVQAAPSQVAPPYGEEVVRDGKTYKWNASAGKYQLK